MQTYGKSSISLAIALSALAGYIDANGFITTGGFFVSFMSGNSTRLGIAIGSWQIADIVTSLGIILTFVVGVILGSVIAARAGIFRKKAVLLFVAMLLATGATFSKFGTSALLVFPLVLAMGAENAVFQKEGEVSIGLTYMTGTLVKMGQRIAAAFNGQSSNGAMLYFYLWLGLVCGVMLGAIAHDRLGNFSLWIGAGFALVLALLAPKSNI